MLVGHSLLQAYTFPLSHNAFLWERGRGEGVNNLHNLAKRKPTIIDTLIPDPSPLAKSAPREGRLCNSAAFYKKKGGFTLIEILIVILIISIVAGFALLSVGSNQNKRFEALANELINELTLAEEEAMLRAVTLGLGFSNNSFRFYEYHEPNRAWQALPGSSFGQHQLPDQTQITVKVQNKEVPLNKPPQIIITANGDTPPFVILIGKPEETPRYQIVGEGNGNITGGRYHEEE